jgi:organic radical activating enzyme
VYLQITTKCNMHCDHCCYSCTMKGKHMDWATVCDAVAFARETDGEMVSIGGGEPTLHPRFFDVLGMCLTDFNYVWMATNGSQTAIMYRLASIIDGYDEGDGDNPYDMDEDEYSYYNWQDTHTIYQEGKLSVALSQDYWHDPIDNRIVELWTKRAKGSYTKPTHYEIRNVSQSRSGAAAQGRAKKTGAGWGDQCVCGDLVIRPDGKIKMCGCGGAPIVGDVWSGVGDKWARVMESDEFRDSNCYRGIRNRKAA